MIKLLDFLTSSGVSIDRDNYKIHLAVASGNNRPLKEFLKGKFEDWQGVQTQKNFPCKHVLSLIQLGGDRWLFAGVYKVHSVEPYKTKWWYELTHLPNQEDLIGRVVAHYHRSGRASYRKSSGIENDISLHEYLPERMSIEGYPGHNHVCISFSELGLIVGQLEKTWYGALSTIKGIYCITDITNGKQYVGKADGEDGIWQRWSTYVNNGHGDNKALRQLLKEKGLGYKENFQFSLIEVADFKTPDQEIGQRESHWKNVLCSREFGYNKN